ncbi:hypothetical protein BGZ94_002952 [Podila epigama]|nr:hypothetical protein BGZ94_002952 [Podila epigama]
MATKPSAVTVTMTDTATNTPQPTPTKNYILPDGAGNVPVGTETIFNLPTNTAPFTYPSGLPQGNGGPNDPNYARNPTTGPTDNSDNIGMIVGITAAGVAVVAIFGLLFQRYRAQARTNTLNSHQTRSRTKHSQSAHHHQQQNGNHPSSGSGDEERGDRAKLAKSFTIRKPPSVYVEDDQDLDQTGHPRFKSDSDARNHPYYGDRTPGLIEYELSDTSGQKYGPSSVAERKRYVEQQQRKVMDEYEMYNPHRDQPPPSPYPPSIHTQQTSAPSYMSAAPLSPPITPSLTPSMGGRSPRVHHPTAHSPFGRPMHQDQDDYKY